MDEWHERARLTRVPYLASGNYFYNRDANREVMMDDLKYLQADSILAEFSQAGASVSR